jgi:hypothetical protein
VIPDEAREQAFTEWFFSKAGNGHDDCYESFAAGYSARDPEVAALKALIEKVQSVEGIEATLDKAEREYERKRLDHIIRCHPNRPDWDEAAWKRDYPFPGSKNAYFAAALLVSVPSSVPPFALNADHLHRQREFSQKTFGPGERLAGVLDHIRKELVEVEAEPKDMSEWADLAILAFDGALRQGHDPQAMLDAILAKQTKNEGRQWPDWRTQPTDRAIEHVRESEPSSVPREQDTETDEVKP